jgi:hypothetical protein
MKSTVTATTRMKSTVTATTRMKSTVTATLTSRVVLAPSGVRILAFTGK